MQRLTGAALAVALVLGARGAASAADSKEAMAVVDKAIKAIGGEKLAKAKATASKSKGKFSFGGNESEFVSESTVQGLDHLRSEFEVEANGNKFKVTTVLAGDKGWRKFNDMVMELDKAAVENEKRTIYLQVVPSAVLPLKDKAFKVEAAQDEKVGDKPAAVLKITGPDGKDFTLYFDKASGLPVKQVAKVSDFMGNEFTQETTYSDYKEFQGIKRATKIENKREGQKFVEVELTEFKLLDKLDEKTFAAPE